MNEFCRQTYESLLGQVDKPARYLGNELGAVRKDLRSISVHFALAFPEVYEIAQSHPGLQILYDLLNRRPDVYAERVYAPWIDMEALLRRHRQPLVSLETFTPLFRFDVVGFSLQFELTYTNVLTMLDLGGIPLRAADRGDDDPLDRRGWSRGDPPEPLAAFSTPFVHRRRRGAHDRDRARLEPSCKAKGVPRRERLVALAELRGVYVPSLYAVVVDCRRPASRCVERALEPGLPRPVERDLVAGPQQVPVPRRRPRRRGPRPSSIACRSRSRAAAPRAAASVRRA